MSGEPRVRNRLLALIAFVLVIAGLKLSYPLTMPLAVMVFVVAAVWPIAPLLKRVLPASLAYAGAVLALFLILAGFVLVIYLAVTEVAQTLTAQQDRFHALFDQYADWASEHGLSVPGGKGGYQQVSGLVQVVALELYSVLGYLGVIVLLVVMGLPEVPDLARNLRQRFAGEERREVLAAIEAIAERFRIYVGMTVAMSLLTGLASALWAWAVGLDLALIWGILNFLLNFVPVIGNIIGIVPPVLYAAIQFGGWEMPAVVFAGFTVLQLVISNVVYPLVQGRGMAMRPVAVIVALLFWGWLWGLVGALLAVPLTAGLVILCRHFDSAAWVAALIAREE